MKIVYSSVVSGILGAVIGISVALLVMSESANKRAFVFEQKQKCREVAEKWNRDPDNIVLERVDYSQSRNSCLIATEEYFQSSDHKTHETFRIKDLFTDEGLFTKHCTDDECVEVLTELDKRFTSLL